MFLGWDSMFWDRGSMFWGFFERAPQAPRGALKAPRGAKHRPSPGGAEGPLWGAEGAPRREAPPEELSAEGAQAALSSSLKARSRKPRGHKTRLK